MNDKLIQFGQSVQMTEDSWRVKKVSMVVTEHTTVGEIVKWARKKNNDRCPDEIYILELSDSKTEQR